MRKSDFLKLNFKDIARGLFMAIATPIVVVLQQVLDSGVWKFNWKLLAMAGVAGGFSYLVKNFFTDSKDKALKKEN